MPLALLLSPDDQAVSAITGVLEEMSVTCERPMDGPSAAKKLSTQNFDLVLVDCENLPAAKLIFDVCRHPKSGSSPVPIAIVDGRAGLPTAFRLGAELILTKPVAKDQARTTIRTAVSRLKKEEPVLRSAYPVEPPVAPVDTVPEVRAQAAAASTTAGPAVSAKPVEAPEPARTVARMKSVVEENSVAPAAERASLPSRDLAPPQSFAPAPKPVRQEPTPIKVFEDSGPLTDPVLADIDADTPTPALTAYQPAPKKGSGSLYLLLFLMLAGGGFYAAWMYQPGFRDTVQPWVNRALGSVKAPGQSTKPAPQPSSVLTPAVPAPPAQATTLQATQAQDAAASGSQPSISTTAPPAAGDAETATKESAPSGKTETPAPAGADSAKTQTPIDSSSESESEQVEPKKRVLAAVPYDEELPGEKTAIILSSQGAEKRLIHHIQPPYPATARKDRLEGTVVLKAVVSDTGKVAGVRVVEGHPTLATAAIATVKQWRYRPYIRNGKAMPFQTVVLVDFQRH